MSSAYAAISNTDGKLSAAEWSDFKSTLKSLSLLQGHVGAWFAEEGEISSMIVCFEVEDHQLKFVRDKLAEMARKYRQRAIALAVADAQMIGPKE